MLRLIVAAVALASAFSSVAVADEGPTFTGPLTNRETSFVRDVQQDLMDRFPHVGDALAKGYVRYTAPDESGAISYANQQWTSDPTHPSQLWYDKNGNLLGADFSVLRPGHEARPQVWGVDPGRWVELEGHVHYVTTDSSGGAKYDQWVWNHDWVAAGGSLTQPSPSTLVSMRRVKTIKDVTTIFEFPTIWDLIVWVKPNPYGPFAWKNPNVYP